MSSCKRSMIEINIFKMPFVYFESFLKVLWVHMHRIGVSEYSCTLAVQCTIVNTISKTFFLFLLIHEKFSEVRNLRKFAQLRPFTASSKYLKNKF